ncbi:isoprenoid synthase domain-containing protein [Aspergillus coremiiformis]|uniref:Isoprenoid synthase domain-containing protein n=1 Tax=Aspergillus coremiiformis TaxID=138285 RepID=A0A5N6ZI82_9EURO|nr:isoprenoid synthase domain-containing protein [Aspergillus coremiiformis]
MSRAHWVHDSQKRSLATLSDYLQESIGDSTTDIHLSMIRFAGSIHLAQDRGHDPLLNNIVNLWAKHRIIVKDLFSYDKDCLEHDACDSVIVNAVQVLRGELGVSLETAKEVARTIQLDTEREIHGLYMEVLSRTGIDSTEVRYIRALVESLAGNVFCSSTAGRNAMPLVGKSVDGE